MTKEEIMKRYPITDEEKAINKKAKEEIEQRLLEEEDKPVAVAKVGDEVIIGGNGCDIGVVTYLWNDSVDVLEASGEVNTYEFDEITATGNTYPQLTVLLDAMEENVPIV